MGYNKKLSIIEKNPYPNSRSIRKRKLFREALNPRR